MGECSCVGRVQYDTVGRERTHVDAGASEIRARVVGSCMHVCVCVAAWLKKNKTAHITARTQTFLHGSGVVLIYPKIVL